MANGKKTGGRDFRPGVSGNPGGRPRVPDEVRNAARQHTEEAIEVLAGIAANSNAPPSARVQAAQALLDRGWGKATQHVEARTGPLDDLSEQDQRSLYAALLGLSEDEEDETGQSVH